jgi:hypothetical protein
LNRGAISASDGNCTDELASSVCRSSSNPSSTTGAPLSPDVDATKKSPKTAGGVIRLGGRGPFHAFSLTTGLGSRSPVGEEDAGRRPNSRKEDLGGEKDLALAADAFDVEACFSQILDSSVGKPIRVQKSASSSSPLRPVAKSGGGTRDSSTRPCQATSSAIDNSSSPPEISPRRPKREPDPVKPADDRPAGVFPWPIGCRIM